MLNTIYFINNGILCMIYYFAIINNIKNINSYFNFKNLSNYLNFSITFGFIFSFLFNKFFFKKVNYLKLMTILSILINFLYFIFVFFVFLNLNEKLKITILIIICFLLGFFSYFYQEISYYIASLYTFEQTKNINLGIGIGSILCSTSLIIISYFKSKNIFLIFNLFIFIFVIYYYSVLIYFLTKNKNLKIKKLQNEKIKFKLLKFCFIDILDLFLGIFISSIFTFLVFPNFYLIFKFENKGNFFNIILWVSSISDLISKFINEKLVLKSKNKIFIINLFRIIICFIFIIFIKFLIFTDNLKKIIILILIIIYLLTNGLIINSCFYLTTFSDNNIKIKFAKSKIILFGLYFGIFYSTFSNLLIFN